MEESNQSMARGLKLSLNLLAIIATPFLLLGVMGAVLLAAISVLIRDAGGYQSYFKYLGIVLLFYVTGRSLLLMAEFIRRNHTQELTENLLQKFSLLVMKEVTFIIAYNLGVATVVNILCVLTGYTRDYQLFLPLFAFPAIVAGFINYKISDKMKCFQDEPLAY